jgi:hypothetical protein
MDCDDGDGRVDYHTFLDDHTMMTMLFPLCAENAVQYEHMPVQKAPKFKSSRKPEEWKRTTKIIKTPIRKFQSPI